MGTQSVHDIAVLMDWSIDAISAELARPQRAFFIVTNARSMPESQAQAVNAFIARNLTMAAQRVGVDFAVVSRLDSTLRGHFHAEMLALQDGLAYKPHAWIIAPLFLEGGRYTIGDTQYVSDGECLTPVGDTEFARDAAFAFKASDLRQWVEEKTAGAVSAADVVSVSIEDLRLGGPAQVAARLSEVPQGGVCVVNGASNRDMEVFMQGLLAVEADGRRFPVSRRRIVHPRVAGAIGARATHAVGDGRRRQGGSAHRGGIACPPHNAAAQPSACQRQRTRHPSRC